MKFKLNNQVVIDTKLEDIFKNKIGTIFQINKGSTFQYLVAISNMGVYWFEEDDLTILNPVINVAHSHLLIDFDNNK